MLCDAVYQQGESSAFALNTLSVKTKQEIRELKSYFRIGVEQLRIAKHSKWHVGALCLCPGHHSRNKMENRKQKETAEICHCCVKPATSVN